MVRYVRYTIIMLSVVFLLATSVSAAMPQNTPTSPFMPKSQTTEPSDATIKQPFAPDAAPLHMPIQPEMSGPMTSDTIEPSVSAPVGSLPTSMPRNPDSLPQEVNPRQKPLEP